MKRILPAIVIVALGAIGWFLWPKSVSDEPLQTNAEGAEEETVEDIDDLFVLGPTLTPDSGTDDRDWQRERGAVTDAQREQWRERRRQRREQRRERWHNASPEERKAWAEQRVNIEPLGEGPTQIEALDMLEAMRELRPEMRSCIRSNGGFGALRDAMRSADAGMRGGLTVAFELSGEGAVNDGSLTIRPAPPASYSKCFEQAMSKLNAPVPGGDGAAIEIRLGGRSRNRPRVPQTEPQAAQEPSAQ